LALDGVGGKCHAPAALTLEKTRYPLYRSLGGPQSRSGQVRKISPPPGFDPRTVQPASSRYTDYAIPASIPQGCNIYRDPVKNHHYRNFQSSMQRDFWTIKLTETSDAVLYNKKNPYPSREAMAFITVGTRSVYMTYFLEYPMEQISTALDDLRKAYYL